MKYITIILILFCTTGLFAQNVVRDDLGRNNPNLQAPKGSYDIIIDTTKGIHIVDMTPDILMRIEANRQPFTYAYINIAPSITVRIHPKNDPSVQTTKSRRDEE